jgi:hypothetical protein
MEDEPADAAPLRHDRRAGAVGREPVHATLGHVAEVDVARSVGAGRFEQAEPGGDGVHGVGAT